MKITLLTSGLDTRAERDRVVLAHARTLAADHDVELIDVGPPDQLRPVQVPGVTVRHLADAEPAEADSELSALAQRPSAWVPRRWDQAATALTDRLLGDLLPTLTQRVVVTTTPGLLAAAVGRLPRTAHLLHLDFTAINTDADQLEAVLTCAPDAAAVVVPTQAQADWLRAHPQLDDVTVCAVPAPAPGPEQPRSLLDQPIILAPSPVVRGKAHADLLDVFADIPGASRDWRVRILGGAERSLTLRAVRRLALYDRVELFDDPPDLAGEWARAGIAALTSFRTTGPIALQEAFAAGVPVVAYDAPVGPSELIEHGANGLLVRRGDGVALRAALTALMQDAALRRKLGEGALATAERFSASRIAELWADLLDRAAAPAEAPEAAVALEATPVTTAPELTPEQSRQELLGHTVAALAGVDGWFLLPAQAEFPPTIVVPADQQRAVLDALAAAPYPDWCSVATGEGDHWQPWRGPAADAVRALGRFRLAGLVVAPWPTTDGQVSPLAHGAGHQVEFWTRDDADVLHAPRANPYLDTVRNADLDATVDIAGHAVRVISTFQGRLVEQCDFPIDVVYTWVDDSDPDWQQQRAHAEDAADGQLLRKEAAGDARFRNRDELRYSLRSIHAHAPWVRRIFLVTAGQRPDWLVDHPRVTVVDHADILPPDALPTFNSHAIESALHKIPGLSEHYVYFNDDVFLGRPVGPERFFSPAGDFAAFLSSRTLGLEGHDDRPFVRAGLNNRRLLQQRLGITNTHTVAHTPHPMRRSVVTALCEEFADAVEATARSPFRAPRDVSVTASLVQHYGLATGEAFRSSLDLAFVDTSRINVKRRLKDLLARESEAFCLGDHHHNALSERDLNQALVEFFEAYFPVRPPWEAEPGR